MAFVPLEELNYDVHAIPERHAVTTHPESLANSDEVIDAKLSKSAKDRKVVTLTTQLLIAKVTQLTAVCEAVVADNARLSGRIEAILALMGPRSVTCTPSPVPPHFTDGTAAGRVSPAVPVVAAFPIRDEPHQAPRLMFFADGREL